MTIKVRLPPDEESWMLAESRFDMLETVDRLTVADDQGDEAAFGFGRLFEYTRDPDPTRDPAVAAALARGGTVAARFWHIAGRLGLPSAMPAAAHTELRERTGEGWRARWWTTAAEPDEAYVVLEVDDAAFAPRALLLQHVQTKRNIAIRFTQVHGNESQALLSSESEALRALSDSDYEAQPV